MTPRTAGFVGAGVAFALSGLMVGVLPAVLSSYEVLRWLYALDLAQWLAEAVWAGRFPDPLFDALSRFLLLLALLSFAAAGMSAVPRHKRGPRA